MSKPLKICSRCVLDKSIPNIEFDENGECNYCKLHDILDKDFPTGKEGKRQLGLLFEDIRDAGKGKEYDCIVGVSGGVDSTYLVHIAKKYGLNPLAVHLDNGWDSEIAVSNIKNSIEKLGVDLYTYVIDWREVRDIHLSLIKASYPWVDGTTDLAIVSTLYRVAAENGIRYVLQGSDFRTEGKQPTKWTYIDGKIIKSIHKKYGSFSKLSSFPILTLSKFINYELLKKIKTLRPLYYLDYDKKKAKEFLKKNYAWKDYGGHHHESIFTRFIIGYWLPNKFGIDKRKITFAAQVRSGLMSRERALKELKSSPYEVGRIEEDKDYIVKKLGITMEDFVKYFGSTNTSYTDYPSYKSIFEIVKRYGDFVFKVFRMKPMITYQLPTFPNSEK